MRLNGLGFLLVIAYYAVVGIGGWRFVRGHGQGWRFIVWVFLLFGPIGAVMALFARRGARAGERMSTEEPRS